MCRKACVICLIITLSVASSVCAKNTSPPEEIDQLIDAVAHQHDMGDAAQAESALVKVGEPAADRLAYRLARERYSPGFDRLVWVFAQIDADRAADTLADMLPSGWMVCYPGNRDFSQSNFFQSNFVTIGTASVKPLLKIASNKPYPWYGPQHCAERILREDLVDKGVIGEFLLINLLRILAVLVSFLIVFTQLRRIRTHRRARTLLRLIAVCLGIVLVFPAVKALVMLDALGYWPRSEDGMKLAIFGILALIWIWVIWKQISGDHDRDNDRPTWSGTGDEYVTGFDGISSPVEKRPTGYGEKDINEY